MMLSTVDVLYKSSCVYCEKKRKQIIKAIVSCEKRKKLSLCQCDGLEEASCQPDKSERKHSLLFRATVSSHRSDSPLTPSFHNRILLPAASRMRHAFKFLWLLRKILFDDPLRGDPRLNKQLPVNSLFKALHKSLSRLFFTKMMPE